MRFVSRLMKLTKQPLTYFFCPYLYFRMCLGASIFSGKIKMWIQKIYTKTHSMLHENIQSEIRTGLRKIITTQLGIHCNL
jgi:hypothetical protein